MRRNGDVSLPHVVTGLWGIQTPQRKSQVAIYLERNNDLDWVVHYSVPRALAE